MSNQPAFLITIDTEGDNLWARCQGPISTRNTMFLPRFQALCERHGLKPTWLTNYEMATDTAFQEFGKDVISRGKGEIGMHLHAWNSPPLVPLTADDHRFHPYLVEYPDQIMRDKVAYMTELLEDVFSTKMLSHRAGRWAFDSRYARLLVEFGYVADGSVTPGVSWRDNPGSPDGAGGTDYRDFPATPYFLDLDDISRPGNSSLLEVPMTTRRHWLASTVPAAYAMPGIRSISARLAPPVSWLRPNGRNLSAMVELVKRAGRESWSHLEFMLHSSELMPGGSPTFRDEQSIEKLYDDLEQLFEVVAERCHGTPLGSFAQTFIPPGNR